MMSGHPERAATRPGWLRILWLGLCLAAPAMPSMADGVDTVVTVSGAWTVEVIHRATGGYDKPALLVGLHGYGMDQRQMRSLVNIRPNFPHVYVAVRGRYRPREGGHGWFAVSQRADGSFDYSVQEIADAVNDLAALLPSLSARYGSDPHKTHVIGYSQGGTVALQMALQRPDAAASFAGFAGTILPGTEALTPQASFATPVFIGHGELDALISNHDAERTATTLRKAGRLVSLLTFRVPHVVSSAGRNSLIRWLERLPPNTKAKD